MSDSKKPFDAPPSDVPDLLQKDLELDRRARRVPTFSELQAVRSPESNPTQPVKKPVVQQGTQEAWRMERLENVETPAETAQPTQIRNMNAEATEFGRPTLQGARPAPDERTQVASPESLRRASQPAVPAARPVVAPPGLKAATPTMPRADAHDVTIAARPGPVPQRPQAPVPMATQPYAGAPSPIPAATQPHVVPPAAVRTTAPRQSMADAPTLIPPPPAGKSLSEAATLIPPPPAPRVAPAPSGIATDPVTPAVPRPPSRPRLPTADAMPAQRTAGPVPQAPAAPAGAPTQHGHSAQMIDLPPVDDGAFAPTRVRDLPTLDPATRPAPQRKAPPSPVAFAQQRDSAPAADLPDAIPADLKTTQPGGFRAPPMALLEVEPPHGEETPPQRPAVVRRPASRPLPPAPAQDDVVTAEPAALWRRLGAWLTDLLFVGVIVLGMLVLALEVIAPRNLPASSQLALVALPALGLGGILAFVYTALFAFLWDGRTPGRRLMGIHLVTATGHAPGPSRALLRAAFSLLSFGLFLSGFWLALFDRHGQTLHDKLTRTFVVKLQDA